MVRGIHYSCYKRSAGRNCLNIPFPLYLMAFEELHLKIKHCIDKIYDVYSSKQETLNQLFQRLPLLLGQGLGLTLLRSSISIKDKTVSQCSYKTWIRFLYIAHSVSLKLTHSGQVISSVVLLISRPRVTFLLSCFRFSVHLISSSGTHLCSPISELSGA